MPIPPCAANSGEKDWSNSGKLIRHHGAAPWNDLISLLETDKPKAKAYGSKRYNARSCTPLRDQMGIHSTVPGGRYPLKKGRSAHCTIHHKTIHFITVEGRQRQGTP